MNSDSEWNVQACKLHKISLKHTNKYINLEAKNEGTIIIACDILALPNTHSYNFLKISQTGMGYSIMTITQNKH